MKLAKANHLYILQKFGLPIHNTLVISRRPRGKTTVTATSSGFTSSSSSSVAPAVNFASIAVSSDQHGGGARMTFDDMGWS